MQGNAGDMKYLAVFYDMMREYQDGARKESLGDSTVLLRMKRL